jgi:hypothetical protein
MNLALLDETTGRVVARLAKPVLEPELAWECTGDVDHVVFVQGADLDGDEVYLTYGAMPWRCLVHGRPRRWRDGRLSASENGRCWWPGACDSSTPGAVSSARRRRRGSGGSCREWP